MGVVAVPHLWLKYKVTICTLTEKAELFFYICKFYFHYQLRNNGPSAFSKVMMTLQWPYKYKNNTLLYIVQYEIDGPMNCTSDMEINPLKIKVSRTFPLSGMKYVWLFCKHSK